MNTLKTLLVTLVGLVIAGTIAVFTASVMVALAGIGVVLFAARAISVRLQPQAAPAYAYANNGSEKIQRVWNDGRGTIIDM